MIEKVYAIPGTINDYTICIPSLKPEGSIEMIGLPDGPNMVAGHDGCWYYLEFSAVDKNTKPTGNFNW